MFGRYVVCFVVALGCAKGAAEAPVTIDSGTVDSSVIDSGAPIDSGTIDTGTMPETPPMALPTCTDKLKNGSETDVDCGGSCPDCKIGEACEVSSDCETAICTASRCVGPSCTDLAKNAAETDIDCGGPKCPKCMAGSGCVESTDCESSVCTATKCAAASCIDAVKNGTETDVDCGGSACPKCINGKDCTAPSDCASAFCVGNKCVTVSCTDSVKNGSESDVDCGGTCAKCLAGKDCGSAADCKSAACTGGKCVASCIDGVKNGLETDIDCGGSCAACAIGKTCITQDDCADGICSSSGKCIYPESCLALHTARPALASGIYRLEIPGGMGPGVPFASYCDMATAGGGWTLVLKANGGNSTFSYTSSYWTNTKLLNETSLGIDTTEAKLEAYLWVPFTNILAEMLDGSIRSQILYVSGTSMLGRMSSSYQSLSLGRSGWKSLLSSASLQPQCNKEGINVVPDPGWPDPVTLPELAQVRIGIIGNNEADCLSPDSFIGIGGRVNVCGTNSAISVGSVAGCGGDLGGDPYARVAWGYVLVR